MGHSGVFLEEPQQQIGAIIYNYGRLDRAKAGGLVWIFRRRYSGRVFLTGWP